MVDRSLIRATLENAAKAPFYRRAWGDAWRGIDDLDGLARLPVLDKAAAIRHQRDLLTGPRPPGVGVVSSGTTRSRGTLHVFRWEGEVAARAPPAPTAEEEADDPFPGWTLVVVGAHHGWPSARSRPDELRVPWTYHANGIAMIQAALSEPQPDGRRVTAMRLSAGALKTVTAALLEQGHADLAALGVRWIGTNGSRLSPHWRALIESAWDARVFDNFSLSEVPTPATECSGCGALHFGWPPIAYELLELDSDTISRTPRGRLVVSTLAPWVTTMPLIRYDTGDVVEIGPVCSMHSEPGLRWMGRARRGVVLPDGRFVLAPAAVQDALEARPDTERNAHPSRTAGLVRSSELGLPRWTVELDARSSRPRAFLHVELRFDPALHDRAARAARDDIRAAVLAGDMTLAEAVAAGELTFDVGVHPARALEPPGDKFE